jgi:group I intron endonuclease
MSFLIYKHTSPSGKSYIGLTKKLKVRNSTHKGGRSGCVAFIAAIKKYGWDNFTHEVLENGLTLTQANEREEYWIDYYKSLSPTGYNLHSGGDVHTTSEETKLRISAAKKGKPAHNKGKPSKRKGIPLSEAHKAAIKAAYNYIPRTSEWKMEQSIAKTHLKKPVSVEGKIYDSVAAAMKALNLHRSTIMNRLNSPHNPEYYYL